MTVYATGDSIANQQIEQILDNRESAIDRKMPGVLGTQMKNVIGVSSNRMAGFDSIIIGGGIIGCSLGRLLAEQGLRVAIIDGQAPGQEASWAAAGMLSPSAEAEEDSPLFQLCRASLRAYAPLVEELRCETGIDPQYRTEGTLLIYRDEQEHAQMLSSMEWQRAHNVPLEELTAAELRKLEPNLGSFPGALFLPQDHQIDNRLLMEALVQSCRQRGVEFLLGSAVREVAQTGNRASGVVLARNSGSTSIEAAKIINTAGAWAGGITIAGLAPIAIRPVKGHMVALGTRPGTLRHVIRHGHGYLVPRRDSRILVGGTMEEADFDKSPRAAALAGLLHTAEELCPTLGNSIVVEFWTGLRPASLDGLPVLGPTALDGYWVALGHFRNGILLAPITAQILCSWLVTGKPSIPVDAFIPQRFHA